MALSLSASPHGFDAYVAFGLRWPQNASQGAPERVIDVEATAVEGNTTRQSSTRTVTTNQAQTPSQDLNQKQVPFQNAAQRRLASPEAQIAAYTRPARQGQAPRLLYATTTPGQQFEAWA